MIDGVRRYLSQQPKYLRERVAVLERERIKGERPRVEIDAEITKLQTQLGRIARYASEANGDDICPDCFSLTGQRHVLLAINSDDQKFDLFRCGECREIFETRIQ